MKKMLGCIVIGAIVGCTFLFLIYAVLSKTEDKSPRPEYITLCVPTNNGFGCETWKLEDYVEYQNNSTSSI